MKYALIIGNNKYNDPKLAQLKTPAADSQALAKILGDQTIGSFDQVTPLVNQTDSRVRRAISAFLANKKPDDLVLLYFSGHGVLDDRGRLYLALKDTQLDILKATSIPSAFLTDEMDSCRSKRQILILDCCHSGAFERGTKGEQKAITETTFEGSGFGRVVLTASDSTQYAFEGDQVIKQTELSLFTHFLLDGLKTGEADVNNDGQVSLDEWYDYTYTRVISETPRQVPHKWSYNQRGDLVIARNPFVKKKLAELPYELLHALESSFVGIRESAVNELGNYLKSRDPEMVTLAVAALQKMKEDDSRKISSLAERLLREFEQARAPAAVSSDSIDVTDAETETNREQGKSSLSYPESTSESKSEPLADISFSWENIDVPVASSRLSQRFAFDRSFWLKWMGTIVLGLVFSAALYENSFSNLSYLVHLRFGTLAALIGLVQWWSLRSRLGTWWIAANAITGAFLGALHFQLYQTTDWGHEDLLILQGIWLLSNSVLGLLLVRGAEQKPANIPLEPSALVETGPRQNPFVLMLSIFLVFYAFLAWIDASRDSGFMSIADSLFYAFWIGKGIASILLGLSFFLTKDIPRNLGFVSLFLFAVLSGIFGALLMVNSEFPLHFFGVSGMMALIAAIFFAFQRDTWSRIRYILLLVYLILVGMVYLGIDDYYGGYTYYVLSGIAAFITAIFFFVHRERLST